MVAFKSASQHENFCADSVEPEAGWDEFLDNGIFREFISSPNRRLTLDTGHIGFLYNTEVIINYAMMTNTLLQLYKSSDSDTFESSAIRPSVHALRSKASLFQRYVSTDAKQGYMLSRRPLCRVK